MQQIQALKKNKNLGGEWGAKKGLKSPLYEEKEKFGIAIFRQQVLAYHKNIAPFLIF